MLNVLATCLPLVLGGPMAVAELAGSVWQRVDGRAFPTPVPVRVRLFDGGLCVAEAWADANGAYRLTARPGAYWLQVLAGEIEVHAEPVRLDAGSFARSFVVDFPSAARPGRPVAISVWPWATPSDAPRRPKLIPEPRPLETPWSALLARPEATSSGRAVAPARPPTEVPRANPPLRDEATR